MKTLCTFSGKFGDVLWSLPTVREIARSNGPVDFAVMPAYRSLVTLLLEQEYIGNAFVIENWECTGSPYGDQPWNPPETPGYDIAFHLTYQTTPDEFLASYIARKAGIVLQHPLEPFITIKDDLSDLYGDFAGNFVAVGFNDLYADQKETFVIALSQIFPDTLFLDTRQEPWIDAARIIKNARCFIGCRSALHVLAHGLGQKLLIFEPHPHRAGDMPIFKCPWGTESQVKTVDEAMSVLKGWLLD